MIGIDPLFPLPLFFAAATAAAALLAWSHLRLRGLIRPSHLAGLTGLRTLACLLLLVLLLNPHTTRTIPDPDGFGIVVLADASGSMETRDIQGGSLSRAEWVGDWLDNMREGPVSLLRETSRLDVLLFATETAPWNGEYRLLPGRTAIGDTLAAQLNASGGQNPGAVVLLSDGHSNQGSPVMDSARRYRQAGVPVTAIGVGALADGGEIRGFFANPSLRGRQGEEMEVPVRLDNTRNRESTVRLELRDGPDLLESREVTVPARAENHLETFTVTPPRAGGFAYRLSVQPETGPEQTDVATVRVDQPDVFNLLYLAGRPSPELRFLQQAVEGSDQLRLQAVVRTGPESFFHLLTEENERRAPRDQFPHDPAFFGSFDAIIVDGEALVELRENVSLLKDFVAGRGGGFLLRGEANGVPEEISVLLPVVESETGIAPRRQQLTIAAAPVFSQVSGGVLFDRPGLFLDENSPAAFFPEWKRGARPVLQAEGGNGALMAVQAYGAGRVGHLGIIETWRWRLDSQNGVERHRVFWNNTLAWLASNRKPRVAIGGHGGRFELAEEIDLYLEVTGSDFRPSRDASVTARLKTPSGETRQWTLPLSHRVPGRHGRSFVPEETGEFRVSYEIAFPDGETLERESFFVVSAMAGERENTAYREDVLRDLARVTGGRFYAYHQAGGAINIPLSEEVPVLEETRRLAGSFWFLLLLAAPLFVEWWLRRNLGLK